MASRRGPGWEQPSLHGEQVPADRWEADRRPTTPIPLTDEISTAAALIAAGGCSPQCLVSAGVPAPLCDCCCRGAYHGVLADADLPSALRRRKATAR